MGEKIIYVSRKGRSFELKLRDDKNNPGNNKLTTEVEPNDTVLWKLDKDSGLSEITGVKESDPNQPQYQGSQNLLEGKAKNENGAWKASILSKSPGKGKFQNYMIGFKIPGDDTEYWDDPKLLMKT